MQCLGADEEDTLDLRLVPVPRWPGMPAGGYVLSVATAAPVEHLRARLAERLKVEPGRLRLAFGGRDLDDGGTLAKNGIPLGAAARHSNVLVKIDFTLTGGAKPGEAGLGHQSQESRGAASQEGQKQRDAAAQEGQAQDLQPARPPGPPVLARPALLTRAAPGHPLTGLAATNALGAERRASKQELREQMVLAEALRIVAQMARDGTVNWPSIVSLPTRERLEPTIIVSCLERGAPPRAAIWQETRLSDSIGLLARQLERRLRVARGSLVLARGDCDLVGRNLLQAGVRNHDEINFYFRVYPRRR